MQEEKACCKKETEPTKYDVLLENIQDIRDFMEIQAEALVIIAHVLQDKS